MSFGLQIAGVVKKVRKGLERSVSKRAMQEIGNLAVQIIRERTRDGKGVQRPDGNRTKLKPLSPQYIEFRKRFGNLSPFTSPGRSNLTLTGQMLDSIKVVRTSQGKAVVRPSGIREDGKRNADVARWVSRERPFLNLARSEIRLITDEVRRFINAGLR